MKHDENKLKYLTLIKLDVDDVYERIVERKRDYLEIFALRRTREHFPLIFNNRFEKLEMSNLAFASTDLILSLNQFYKIVEQMRWYVMSTEDMPNTVEDFLERKIARLVKAYATVTLYLDVELGISKEAPSFSSHVEDDNSSI